MTDPLLTANQVAQLLQVKRSWVYAETRAKRIPHVRLGRYVRYRLDAIERWVSDIEDGVHPALAGRGQGENASARHLPDEESISRREGRWRDADTARGG